MIKRKRKPKMIRKPKKVYKYLSIFTFFGEIQKVIVEKEGKTEAIIIKLSEFGKRPLGKRIHKDTKFHKLCDTLKEAKKLMIRYQMKEIKNTKAQLKTLNECIKEIKQLKEVDL